MSRSIEKTEEKLDHLRKELSQRNTAIERLEATILEQHHELNSVNG